MILAIAVLAWALTLAAVVSIVVVVRRRPDTVGAGSRVWLGLLVLAMALRAIGATDADSVGRATFDTLGCLVWGSLIVFRLWPQLDRNPFARRKDPEPEPE